MLTTENTAAENSTAITSDGASDHFEPGGGPEAGGRGARVVAWLVTKKQLPSVAPLTVLAGALALAVVLAVVMGLAAQALFVGGWSAGFAWHLMPGSSGGDIVRDAGRAADALGGHVEDLGWAIDVRLGDPVASTPGAVLLALATIALTWFLLRLLLTAAWGLAYAPARFWMWMRRRQEARQPLVPGSQVRLVVDGEVAACTGDGVTIGNQRVGVEAGESWRSDLDDLLPHVEPRSVSDSGAPVGEDS